jgi:paraquat-inducible protein A
MNPVITIAKQFPKTAKTVQLLLMMTLVLFIAGVSLPILTLTKLFIVSNEVSILTGLYQLIEEQQYFIFVVIFLFSIALPLLKLYYLFLLSSRNTADNKRYTKYLHLMHRYGRWSMLDVFVIAVLIMTVKLGALASVKIEIGMYFFTAAVILLMIITSVMVKLESKLEITPDDK